MKKLLLLVLLLGAAVGVVIYTAQAQETQPSSTSYDNGELHIRIDSGKNVSKIMQRTSFTITVTDSSGNPVRAAKMQVVLSMPDMFCGVFPADITEEKPGSYSAVGMPVMKGSWQAKVTIAAAPDSRYSDVTVAHPFQVN